MNSRTLFIATVIVSLCAGLASATDYTWTGANSGLWSDGGNWNPGAPNSATDTAVWFDAAVTNTLVTQDAGAPFTLSSITFTGLAAAHTLQTGQIEFADPTLSYIYQYSANTQTISAPLLLTQNLVIGGTGAGAVNLSGQIDGAGTLTLNNRNTILTLSNALNTFAGAITIQAGTLSAPTAVGYPDYLGGNSTINLGVIGCTDTAVIRLGAATNFTKYIVVNGDGVNQLDFAGNNNPQRSITLNRDLLITAGSAVTGTIFTTAATYVIQGTGGVTVNAATNAIIQYQGAASNTYTGLTWVKSGTLQLRKNASSLRAYGGDLTIGTGAGAAGAAVVSVIANGGQTNSNGNIAINVDGILALGAFTNTCNSLMLTGSGNVSGSGPLYVNGNITSNAHVSTMAVVSPAVVFPAGTHTITVGRGAFALGTPTDDLTLNGALSGAGNVVKEGAGQVFLATGTCTGTLTINAGTVRSNANTWTGVTVGDGSGGANADMLQYNASNVIADTAPVVVNASGKIDMMNRTDTIGTLTMTGPGTIIGVTGAAALTLGGTLTVNAGAPGAGDATITAPLAIGANRIVTVNGTSGDTGLNLSGIVSGNFSLTKSGTGTLTLSGVGANSFGSGGFNINDGTVVMNKTAVVATAATAIAVGNGDATPAVLRLAASSQLPITANVTVNSDGTFNLAGNSQTVTTLVVNSSGTVTASGGGTLTLSGALTENAGGSINLGGSAISGAAANILGSTLATGGGNATFTSLNLTGGTLNTGAGTATISGNVTTVANAATSQIIGATINLGATLRTFTVPNGAADPDLLVQGNITATAGVTKNGAGRMVLQGNNSFAGDLTLGNFAGAANGLTPGGILQVTGTNLGLANIIATVSDIKAAGVANALGASTGNVTLSDATITILGTNVNSAPVAKNFLKTTWGANANPVGYYGSMLANQKFMLDGVNGLAQISFLALDTTNRPAGTSMVIVPVQNSLGTNEKFVFAVAPTQTSGIAPTYIVRQTSGSDPTGDYVVNGANGYGTATYTTPTLSGLNNQSAVVSSTGEVIAADAILHALKLTGDLTGAAGTLYLRADAVYPSSGGGTVSVGPGGLIVNALGATNATVTIARPVTFKNAVTASNANAEGVVYVSGTAAFNGAITASSITKFGPGTMNLGNAGNVLGTLYLDDGKAVVTTTGGMGTAPWLFVSRTGTFDMNNYDVTITAVDGQGIVTNSGPNRRTLTIDNGQSPAWYGTISGNLDLSIGRLGSVFYTDASFTGTTNIWAGSATTYTAAGLSTGNVYINGGGFHPYVANVLNPQITLNTGNIWLSVYSQTSNLVLGGTVLDPTVSRAGVHTTATLFGFGPTCTLSGSVLLTGTPEFGLGCGNGYQYVFATYGATGTVTLSGPITQDVAGRKIIKSGGANLALTNTANNFSYIDSIQGGWVIPSANTLGNSTVTVKDGGGLQTSVAGALNNAASITIGKNGVMQIGSTETAPFTLQTGSALVVTAAGTGSTLTWGGNVTIQPGVILDNNLVVNNLAPAVTPANQGIYFLGSSGTVSTPWVFGTSSNTVFDGFGQSRGNKLTLSSTITEQGATGLSFWAQTVGQPVATSGALAGYPDARIVYSGATVQVSDTSHAITLYGNGWHSMAGVSNSFNVPVNARLDNGGIVDIQTTGGWNGQTINMYGGSLVVDYAAGLGTGVANIQNGGFFRLDQTAVTTGTGAVLPFTGSLTAGTINVKTGGTVVYDHGLAIAGTGGATWSWEPGATIAWTVKNLTWGGLPQTALNYILPPASQGIATVDGTGGNNLLLGNNTRITLGADWTSVYNNGTYSVTLAGVNSAVVGLAPGNTQGRITAPGPSGNYLVVSMPVQFSSTGKLIIGDANTYNTPVNQGATYNTTGFGWTTLPMTQNGTVILNNITNQFGSIDVQAGTARFDTAATTLGGATAINVANNATLYINYATPSLGVSFTGQGVIELVNNTTLTLTAGGQITPGLGANPSLRMASAGTTGAGVTFGAVGTALNITVAGTGGVAGTDFSQFQVPAGSAGGGKVNLTGTTTATLNLALPAWPSVAFPVDLSVDLSTTSTSSKYALKNIGDMTILSYGSRQAATDRFAVVTTSTSKWGVIGDPTVSGSPNPLDYSNTSVVLHGTNLVWNLRKGDTNADHSIDYLDLGNLAGHWNQGGAGIDWSSGDFNCDGTVDYLDLGTLAGQWNTGYTGGVAVPEPATLGLLALGGLALIRRRRR